MIRKVLRGVVLVVGFLAMGAVSFFLTGVLAYLLGYRDGKAIPAVFEWVWLVLWIPVGCGGTVLIWALLTSRRLGQRA